MKLNNKGFAITGFLYAIFAIFVVILSLLLMTLINSKLTIQKLKNQVKDNLNEADVTNINKFAEIVFEEDVVNLNTGDSYNLLNGVSVKRFDGKTLDLIVSYESVPGFTTSVVGTYIITYSTIIDSNTYSNTRTVIVR